MMADFHKTTRKLFDSPPVDLFMNYFAHSGGLFMALKKLNFESDSNGLFKFVADW